ncbi:glucose-6-phosphate dehydrogenase [Buchnera aphidicola]|uniref:glucose-6-phosphate dehydrogenase n=1 Tax=Buchnera aphidicola TaxID=9 RepID=UPI002238142D|nr:glucose-6-phosphate dehydrogenase [Buchnera aphidicola]MCW5197718.1 glucose-6-phosphate dehydrogenase [Buchnera aphidicola (Chaitophorus viminalis)]
MNYNQKILAYDLIIFGAKGDLSKRKLLPSLYQLEKLCKLHINTRIIGVGRANWDAENYRKIVKNCIIKFSNEKINQKIWHKFSKKLLFCNLDVNDTSSFIKLQKIINQDRKMIINYFALPQHTFKFLCKGLKKFKLNLKKDRVILEKPIGNSLKTSKKINIEINKIFKEKRIFRIDHYLGKETILNLLALKFSNSILFTNWNNKTIDHVQITVSEEVGIEGRLSYFEKTGQMRDMIQNHLLQILSILAMSAPINLKANNIRNEKLKILQALRVINEKNINQNTVRGQYTSGTINNTQVSSYIKEIGIKNYSNTETFVAIKVNIDNWKWYGVPFYLRTGKRLPIKYSEIVIYFKPVHMNLFHSSLTNIPLNKIIIRLQPNEGIDIFIMNKFPELDLNYKLKEIKLNFDYKKNFKNLRIYDAYERLLLDSSLGIQSLFVRRDEIEESWKWTDSIIHAWKTKKSKLEFYKAGTWGPKSSDNLLKKDGRCWNIYR